MSLKLKVHLAAAKASLAMPLRGRPALPVDRLEREADRFEPESPKRDPGLGVRTRC
jgi:hypothetical protein